MSYIAFDLDALNAAPNVARAARVSEDTIIGGLLRLWAHAFRCKADVLDELEVRGCFDSAADVMPALKAFGFLAEAPKGKLRVRGAERYLRISEARSKGGKAASGNLKRGTRQPGGQPELVPGYSPAPAGTQPGVSPGSFPALTPSTEHRTPNTESKSSAVLVEPPPSPSRKADKPTDPRHAPLRKRLVDAFATIAGAPYPFGPRDARVVTNLLARAEPDAIAGAWERGLRHQGYPTVATLAQLEQHLAQFVGAPRADTTKGYAQPSIFTETKDVTF